MWVRNFNIDVRRVDLRSCVIVGLVLRLVVVESISVRGHTTVVSMSRSWLSSSRCQDMCCHRDEDRVHCRTEGPCPRSVVGE